MLIALSEAYLGLGQLSPQPFMSLLTVASLDYRFCNLIGSPPSRDTTSDDFSDRLLHDALWLALVQDWLWVNVHLVVWLCGAGLAAFIAKYFTIETRSALCHTFIIATLNPLAQWASR